MAATTVSFVLCLIYLAFLPFHAWALAVLVGASALVVMLLGRPGDAVTAGITTAVIMAVAAVSPQHAWQQPILRLADTVVGVAVGVVAAWTGIQVKRLLPARSVLPRPRSRSNYPNGPWRVGPRIRLPPPGAGGARRTPCSDWVWPGGHQPQPARRLPRRTEPFY